MFRLKKYIACLLLLLFVRVMAPEAVVLQWHHHEHTEEVHKQSEAGLKLDKKHQHCHIDQLFNAPFAPAQKVAIQAVLIPFTDTYSVRNSFVWKFTFPHNTCLRGPPMA